MMMKCAEPNFEDERTLLSARPVVPLEKIEAKARHRRHWFLGGAFAMAMMLGAASALVASYLKMRNIPQTATELSIQPNVATAVAEGAPADTPVVDNTTMAETEATPTPPPVTSKKEPAPKHRAVIVQPEPIEDRDTRNLSEDEQLNRIRDAVLYDEWQERRARRALRRDRQRPERYNHRDLSNLDEIFEGRRPDRP